MFGISICTIVDIIYRRVAWNDMLAHSFTLRNNTLYDFLTLTRNRVIEVTEIFSGTDITEDITIVSRTLLNISQSEPNQKFVFFRYNAALPKPTIWLK